VEPPAPESDQLSQLFIAPLASFVAERKRIAVALKAAGRAQEAKEVLKIPRPSVSAWAVNQLARQEPELIRGFADVTRRLRDAQLGPAAGGAAGGAEVMVEHREALKRLRARAEEILAAAGQAARPAILERVVRNLRVGVAGDETRRTIEEGRLVHDLDEPGFGGLLGAPEASGDDDATDDDEDAAAAPAAPSPRAAAPRAAPAASLTAARQTRDKAEREAAARATEEARAREREEKERAREAERVRARARLEAEQRVKIVRGDAELARRAQEREERAIEAARRALGEAEERLQRAREAVARADGELEAAEAALRDLGR
jgi:hypothetical protein